MEEFRAAMEMIMNSQLFPLLMGLGFIPAAGMTFLIASIKWLFPSASVFQLSLIVLDCIAITAWIVLCRLDALNKRSEMEVLKMKSQRGSNKEGEKIMQTVQSPMRTTDSSEPTSPSTATGLPVFAVIAIFVASMVLLVQPLDVRKPLLTLTPTQMQQFRTKLDPLLIQLHEADQRAAENLNQAVLDDFTVWNKRVPGFVENVNALGSQLGLLGVVMWDGREVMSSAVQVTFQEQVVSPLQLQQAIQSHVADFHQQLAANRQEFYYGIGKALDESDFPPESMVWLQQQVFQFSKQQTLMADQIAIQAAVAPIMSTSVIYLSQKFFLGWLEKRSASMGASLLIKGAKSTLLTVGLAIGVDSMISGTLEDQMQDDIQQQMTLTEQSIQDDLKNYAGQQIQASESILDMILQNIEVKK